MKKFRMMLPMVAFVFAVVGAVAGSFLPPVTSGFYKVNPTTCSTTAQSLDQGNCQLGLGSNRPACTVSIASHPTAYNDNACIDVLRYIP